MASYLHRDHLASVRAITDASGALVERTAYSPYGAEDNEAGLTNPTPEEHGFIGERHDASTGLQYLNARYYDPELGRFIQPDWWEVTQAGVGTNRYAYSFNDPVNNSDPSGNRLLKLLFDPIGANIGIFILNNYYGLDYKYGAMSPDDLRMRTPSTVVQSGSGEDESDQESENRRSNNSESGATSTTGSPGPNCDPDDCEELDSDVPDNRLSHVFHPKHRMDPVVSEFGGTRRAFNAIQREAQRAFADGRITVNSNGVFSGEIQLTVGRSQVHVLSGIVRNGVFRLVNASRMNIP